MDVRDKTVVVTGAGRGIGRAIAVRLARQGANLALLDCNAADLQSSVVLCGEQGVQARGYGVDVSDEAGVCAAMAGVAADFGRLDGLVNNAGILRDALLVKVKDGAIVDSMSLDKWNAVIGVNMTD